jgi:hypothetical protein
MVLLSVKAGLRAREVANLTWPMVLDPCGDISPVIELRDEAAKKKNAIMTELFSCATKVMTSQFMAKSLKFVQRRISHQP